MQLSESRTHREVKTSYRDNQGGQNWDFTIIAVPYRLRGVYAATQVCLTIQSDGPDRRS